MTAPATAPFPSLDALLADETLRTRLFPICEKQIFCAHAGVSPLPMPAHLAIIRESAAGTTVQQEDGYLKKIAEARRLAAALFGVYDDEVSLLGPTCFGLGFVANGLDWKPGDEVVYYPGDYPANVHPWLALADRGVVPVPLKPEHPGDITPELVAGALSSKTKLVALASAHFVSGRALDADAIGKVTHAAGALFCLDSIQTLGAIRTSLDHVDFAAADSHKWMLGPLAAGLFVVRRAARDRLKPALLGADNVVSKHFIAAERLEYAEGGRRYEPGTMNMLGLAGMKASWAMLHTVGLPAIESRVLAMRRVLLGAMRAAGFEFPVPDPDAHPSGILSGRKPGWDGKTAHATLAKAGVVASLRWTADGRDWLRLSPHFYNTDREIAKVATLIGDL